jgi:hypothetical protein
VRRFGFQGEDNKDSSCGVLDLAGLLLTKYTGLNQGAMHTLLSFPDGDIFVVRHEWGSPSSQLLKLGPKGELR